MVSLDFAGSHHYFSLYSHDSEDLEVKTTDKTENAVFIFLGLGILLNMTFRSSLHSPLNFMISGFFTAKEYSIVYAPYHIFNMRSLVGRHLGRFHLLAIMNTAEMNTAAQVSLE